MNFHNHDSEDSKNFVTSIISIILYSIGIMANTFSIFICLHKELRKTPTFVFMGFMALINITKLLTLILTTFQIQFNSNLNLVALNICFFVLFWKYQSAAYLNVNIIFLLFIEI